MVEIWNPRENGFSLGNRVLFGFDNEFYHVEWIGENDIGVLFHYHG
jgi:hypothetical protein